MRFPLLNFMMKIQRKDNAKSLEKKASHVSMVHQEKSKYVSKNQMRKIVS